MAHDYRTALLAATDLTQVGAVVRSAARAATEADGATFVLRDGELCFYADEDAIAPLWKGQRFPMTECISGWTMLSKQSVCVPDIALDDRIPIDAYRPTFVRSLMMAPIGRRRPVGAIGAYWSVTGAPQPDRLAALERVAEAAAAAIERIGLAGAPWAPNFRVPGASQRPAVLAD